MAGLEEHVDDFEEAGVEIIALSADDEEDARAMQDEEDLSFRVAYGLDVDETAERLGIHVSHGERVHLQPAQFVLDGDGRIALVCHSSGAVGRLDAEEALEEARRAAE